MVLWINKKELVTAFFRFSPDILCHPAVFFRILLEFLLASCWTEVVILPLVLASVLRTVFIDFHFADRIYCHCPFSLLKGFWVTYRINLRIIGDEKFILKSNPPFFKNSLTHREGWYCIDGDQNVLWRKLVRTDGMTEWGITWGPVQQYSGKLFFSKEVPASKDHVFVEKHWSRGVIGSVCKTRKNKPVSAPVC